jgi:hypothetical protein
MAEGVKTQTEEILRIPYIFLNVETDLTDEPEWIAARRIEFHTKSRHLIK